jgi:hypothetical protein
MGSPPNSFSLGPLESSVAEDYGGVFVAVKLKKRNNRNCCHGASRYGISPPLIIGMCASVLFQPSITPASFHSFPKAVQEY